MKLQRLRFGFSGVTFGTSWIFSLAITIAVTFYNEIDAEDSCDALEDTPDPVFTPPMKGYRLVGTPVYFVRAQNEDVCQYVCKVQQSRAGCAAYNFRDTPGSNTHDCQMFNISTIQKTERQNGTHFRVIKQSCKTSPCLCDTSVCGETKDCASLRPGIPFKCECSVNSKESCSALFSSGKITSGVYCINPKKQGPFSVRCDMTSSDGPMTIILRRQDGSENFDRNWADFKEGFGNLNGEFWLGNDKIHRLTSTGVTLNISMKAWDGEERSAVYQSFTIGDENSGYVVNFGAYSGNAGDSFTPQKGQKFSTKDKDNDNNLYSNCAVIRHAPWWHKAPCSHPYGASLMGEYINGGVSQEGEGVQWPSSWKNHYYSLKEARMKINI